MQLEPMKDAAGASRALAPFDADFDFVYVFTSQQVYTPLAGFYLGLANDASGIGRSDQSTWQRLAP